MNSFDAISFFRIRFEVERVRITANRIQDYKLQIVFESASFVVRE